MDQNANLHQKEIENMWENFHFSLYIPMVMG